MLKERFIISCFPLNVLQKYSFLNLAIDALTYQRLKAIRWLVINVGTMFALRIVVFDEDEDLQIFSTKCDFGNLLFSRIKHSKN